MTKGRRHPDKDVRKAIKQATVSGWSIDYGKGHRWGTLRCGEGCQVAVWSTPRSPDVIAKRIDEAVRKCPHQQVADPGNR